MAREYARTYYDIVFNGQPVISCIVPTCKRVEQLIESVVSIDADPYPAKEIIVIDDAMDNATKKACKELKRTLKTPVIYLSTGREDGYNLAMARNMGVVESLGTILLFLDDRLKLESGALEVVSRAEQGKWYHGAKVSKGQVSSKRAFIENFSWIKKRDFVDGGMFNERMTHYGGMSQLTREQYGGKTDFEYEPKAKAHELVKSAGRNRKADIWKAKEIIRKLYE